jgi:hypothetical protein
VHVICSLSQTQLRLRRLLRHASVAVWASEPGSRSKSPPRRSTMTATPGEGSKVPAKADAASGSRDPQQYALVHADEIPELDGRLDGLALSERIDPERFLETRNDNREAEGIQS